MTFTIRDLLWLTVIAIGLGCSALERPARKPAVTYTDGPTPLTEEQFADLQKWLRDGKSIESWSPKPFSVQGMIVEGGNDKQLVIQHGLVSGWLWVHDDFLGGLDPDRLVKVTFEAIEE